MKYVFGIVVLMIASVGIYSKPTFPIKIIKAKEPEVKQQQQQQENRLFRDPAPMEGPLKHLDPSQLYFSNITNLFSQPYELKISLFNNVSFEFNGTVYVAGVWQGWEIQDGRYKNMLFSDGDKCGNRTLLSRVVFVSNAEVGVSDSGIINITRIDQCTYHITAHVSFEGSNFDAPEGLSSPGVVGISFIKTPEVKNIQAEKPQRDQSTCSAVCDMSPITALTKELQSTLVTLQEELKSVTQNDKNSTHLGDKADPISKAKQIYRLCLGILDSTMGVVHNVAGMIEHNIFNTLQENDSN